MNVTQLEVQKALDLLTAVLWIEMARPHGRDLGLTPGQFSDVAAYASVLCWVLGHKHNMVFGANLETLEEMLKKNHFVPAEDGLWHALPERVN